MNKYQKAIVRDTKKRVRAQKRRGRSIVESFRVSRMFIRYITGTNDYSERGGNVYAEKVVCCQSPKRFKLWIKWGEVARIPRKFKNYIKKNPYWRREPHYEMKFMPEE